jgi:hypothetical protein
MALRRHILQVALLAAVALGCLPGGAFAAGWLGPEPHDPPATDAAPDVAAYGDHSVTVWIGSDQQVYAADRPRGGPWGSPDALETTGPVLDAPPKVVALPTGELLAAWVLDNGAPGFPFPGAVRAALRTPAGRWSAPRTISTTCCPDLRELVAGADGSVLAFWTSRDGAPQTAVLPPAATAFDPPQDLPGGSSETALAVASDGSALAVQPGSACGLSTCVEARFRPAGEGWGAAESVTDTNGNVNGLAVAARPDRGFTAVWSEEQPAGRSQTPPGAIRSSDRTPGARAAWASPAPVATLTGNAAGCPSVFGCVDLAAAGDGTLAAVWQQGPATPAIAASLRAPGGAWQSAETVDAPVAGDAFPTAAFTAGGTPVAAWVSGGGKVVRGAHRSAPAAWTARTLGAGAQAGATPALQDVAADAEGNAVTAWVDAARTQTAGFDGAGPRFSAFSISNIRTANEPVRFTAAADDNWSGPPAFSWLFGDGGSASGGDVTHGYTSGGEYPATATATDGAGNASSQSGRVTITAPPDPCGSTDRDGDGIFDGCDKSDGAQAPTPFKTVNATVVSGAVFVKRPAGAARAAAGAKPPTGFVPLQGAETIPTGSTLDTAHGKVLLRSAKDTRRHVQRGRFSGGRFLIGQVRKPRTRSGRRSTGLITDLRLTGSSFRRACATAKLATVSRRRSRRRVRRLFGDGKGSFRTRGRTAAATVRGTRWGTQDRCDGTLVIVQRGRVSVRDLVRHRTVLVRAGHAYLARRRD